MSEPTLHHELAGAGSPALVFVHGLCCAGEDWSAQVAALAGKHRILTVDLRGHGRSIGFDSGFDIPTSAADVVSLTRALALGPAVVIGHSMGCRVAVETARLAPDLFRAVVLVDGSALAPAAAPGAPRPAVDFGAVRAGLFDAMFLEGSDPALKRRIIQRASAVAAAVGQSFHDSMVAYDAGRMEAALSALEVPVGIVQSTYMNPERVRVPVAPGMSVPWLTLVERTVRDVRIEIAGGVGHFTMIEAPGAVNAMVAGIAERVAA